MRALAASSVKLNQLGHVFTIGDPVIKRYIRDGYPAGRLAGAARALRNAWLDQRLQALSAEDRAVIARAIALLSSIADS
jgi:hypothetical protein